MPSKVDIANVALRFVGATRITSFGEGTASANVVNDIYDETRLQLLTYPWNFATSRVELARSATAPAFEFNYAYTLPSDWLHTVSLHDNDNGVGTIHHRGEQVNGQHVILADQENVWIRYIKNEVDANLMTPTFRRALALALARDISVALTNSNTLTSELAKKAKEALGAARSNDAMNSSPERRPRGSWANSRAGNHFGHDFQGG